MADRYGATWSSNSSGSRDRRVALVDAVGGAAVADPVLGAGDDTRRPRPRLQGVHEPPRAGGDDRRILRVTLVGPPPVGVAGHRQGRREGPVHPAGQHLPRRDPGDAFHQPGVAGGAETDVVGEDRGAEDVAVAVDGVDAVEDGDRPPLQAPGRRRLPELVGHGDPVGRPVRSRGGAAAAEDGAQVVAPDLRRGDAQTLGLGHLPDLLLQAHPAEQALHAASPRRVEQVGPHRPHPAAGTPRLSSSCLRTW